MRGKDVADFLFGVLQEELREPTVTDEITENDIAVVLFETSIRERTALGLNVVRLNESGLIRELTVFFRPLAALTLIAEVVGARMAERLRSAPAVAAHAAQRWPAPGKEHVRARCALC